MGSCGALSCGAPTSTRGFRPAPSLRLGIWRAAPSPYRAGPLAQASKRGMGGRPGSLSPEPPSDRRTQPLAMQECRPSPEVTDELVDRANLYLERAKAKWDAVEDKPAVVVLAGLAALALYLGLAVLDRLDRLPLVGNVLEMIGLAWTAWYGYNWYASPDFRKGVHSIIRALADRVGINLGDLREDSSQAQNSAVVPDKAKTTKKAGDS